MRICCGRSEGDKDIVIFVVQQYWLIFNYVVQQYWLIFNYAAEGLKKDKGVCSNRSSSRCSGFAINYERS